MVARGDKVVQRRLVTPDLPRPIGLVTRQGRSLSPAALAMIDLLREEMQRLIRTPTERRRSKAGTTRR